MEITIISGRVGQDASIKQGNGNEFTSFSIAVDDSYKKADGTKVEKTNWYNCLVNGTSRAAYIKKGQYLTVSGKLQPKIFQDAQLRPQISLNLAVNQITLGPNPNPTNQAPSYPQNTNQAPAQHASTMPSSGHVIDVIAEETNDDLPF